MEALHIETKAMYAPHAVVEAIEIHRAAPRGLGADRRLYELIDWIRVYCIGIINTATRSTFMYCILVRRDYHVWQTLSGSGSYGRPTDTTVINAHRHTPRRETACQWVRQTERRSVWRPGRWAEVRIVGSKHTHTYTRTRPQRNVDSRALTQSSMCVHTNTTQNQINHKEYDTLTIKDNMTTAENIPNSLK